MEIKRIAVCFNLDDPDQRKLYEHVKKRTNYSSYLLRLVQRDVDGVTGSYSQVINSFVHEEEQPVNVDFINSMIK